MLKAKLAIVLFSLFLFTGILFAETSCLFVSAELDPGAEADLFLIDQLDEWGYTLTIISSTELTEDFDYAPYDFCFASETVGSSSLAPLKGHPIPLFTTEAYASKPTALAWSDPSSGGEVIAQPIIFLDDTNHPLAAGFAEDTELEPVEGSDIEGDPSSYAFCTPTIEHILIAAMAEDIAKVVVMGVEAEAELTDGTYSMERAALVGFHAGSYEFINEDGYKLIKAGIDWILGLDDSFVKGAIYSTPQSFELAQNYPNPFNPSTTINYNLAKPGQVELSVFNLLGDKVATLVNETKQAGAHSFSFDASELAAGIYLYKLQTANNVFVKKMTLLK